MLGRAEGWRKGTLSPPVMFGMAGGKVPGVGLWRGSRARGVLGLCAPLPHAGTGPYPDGDGGASPPGWEEPHDCTC